MSVVYELTCSGLEYHQQKYWHVFSSDRMELVLATPVADRFRFRDRIEATFDIDGLSLRVEKAEIMNEDIRVTLRPYANSAPAYDEYMCDGTELIVHYTAGQPHLNLLSTVFLCLKLL